MGIGVNDGCMEDIWSVCRCSEVVGIVGCRMGVGKV